MRKGNVSPEAGQEPPDDVSCERCGSFSIVHVERRATARYCLYNPEAKTQLFNLCQDCRHLGEYVPSKAVIAREVAQLRAARADAPPDPWEPPPAVITTVSGIKRSTIANALRPARPSWDQAFPRGGDDYDARRAA